MGWASLRRVLRQQHALSNLLRKGWSRAMSTQDQVQNDTPISFDALHNKLEMKLSEGTFIKASDLNKLFHGSKSSETLEKAIDILARCRMNPNFLQEDRQSTVLAKACVELSTPHRALEVFLDAVKYGLFPSRKAINELIRDFTDKNDLQGVEKAFELMTMREIEPLGIDHLLLVKATLNNLILSRKEEGGGGLDSLTLEDLEPTLERCRKSIKLYPDTGLRAYYFINGKLATSGLHHLSAQLIEKLKTENILPESVILNMLTDHHLEAGDLSGALASLQAMRAKGFKIPTRRFPRLRDAFAGSEDESLKQSFKDLKLDTEYEEYLKRNPKATSVP